MLVLPQFLNQYLLLLLPALFMAGWGLWLAVRGRSWRWRLAWLAVACSFTAGFWALRTPAATITGPSGNPAVPQAAGEPSPVQITQLNVEFSKPEDIAHFLRSSGGLPTLVEFRADFGFS